MRSIASLFAGGGTMGALMRDNDWSGPSPGPEDRWPSSPARVMLRSRQLMFIARGEDPP